MPPRRDRAWTRRGRQMSASGTANPTSGHGRWRFPGSAAPSCVGMPLATPPGVMTMLWHDLRAAIRALTKNPGFSAVVVLALALGLGVNIAVFDAVNGVLLRPLP